MIKIMHTSWTPQLVYRNSRIAGFVAGRVMLAIDRKPRCCRHCGGKL